MGSPFRASSPAARTACSELPTQTASLGLQARCRTYTTASPADAPIQAVIRHSIFPEPASSALHTTRTSRRGGPVLCATSSPNSGHRARQLGTGDASRSACNQDKSHPRLFSVEKAQQSPPLLRHQQSATRPTSRTGRTAIYAQGQQSKEQKRARPHPAVTAAWKGSGFVILKNDRN